MLLESFAVFFADFGVDAAFSGTGSVVRGIFDNGYVEVQGVATRGPLFRCVEAEVPDAVGETLQIDGRTYTIRNAEPDGTGLALLQLEAP